MGGLAVANTLSTQEHLVDPDIKRNPPSNALPFMPPSTTCNARLHRGDGYCKAQAGMGTPHPGVGRCRLHGGMSAHDDNPDGPRDLMRAAGLEQIINLAETMTHDDQEFLMEVGNNALVVTRAKVLARMQDPDLSPKEMADLSISLQRIDTILAKHPNEEDPDAAPNTPNQAEAIEMSRLLELEKNLGL